MFTYLLQFYQKVRFSAEAKFWVFKNKLLIEGSQDWNSRERRQRYNDEIHEDLPGRPDNSNPRLLYTLMGRTRCYDGASFMVLIGQRSANRPLMMSTGGKQSWRIGFMRTCPKQAIDKTDGIKMILATLGSRDTTTRLFSFEYFSGQSTLTIEINSIKKKKKLCNCITINGSIQQEQCNTRIEGA